MRANEKGTAVYRTGGIRRRLVFAYTVDPVRAKSYLQSKLKVQLKIMTFLEGKPIFMIRDRFAGLRQEDGTYLANTELTRFLEALPTARFTGHTTRPKPRKDRGGVRSRIKARLVDDLPERCRIVAAAAVLGVTYHTVHSWIVAGLPTVAWGNRRAIAREPLRVWLRMNGRLVGR